MIFKEVLLSHLWEELAVLLFVVLVMSVWSARQIRQSYEQPNKQYKENFQLYGSDNRDEEVA